MKIGILASGSGTNAEAIMASVEKGECPVEVAVVISDVLDAGVLERAKKHNVPALYIDPGKYRTKLEPDAENQFVRVLKEAGVELIVLAGFMRIIKDPILDAFPGKIINIHPALLPAFPGLASWKQALDYGVKVAGCTVHFVDKGIDTGPIILQAVVPVSDNDAADMLHAKIQIEEHRIYPEAIRLISEGKVQLQGRKVLITGE